MNFFGPPLGSLLFVIGGLSILSVLILIAGKGQRSKTWPSVIGKVLVAEVRSRYSYRGGTSYYLYVRYHYAVKGTVYHAEVITANPHHYLTQSQAQEALALYRKTKKITVYYDPTRPKNAVLQPGLPPSTWFILPILLGLGLLLLGIAGFVGSLRL